MRSVSHALGNIVVGEKAEASADKECGVAVPRENYATGRCSVNPLARGGVADVPSVTASPACYPY